MTRFNTRIASVAALIVVLSSLAARADSVKIIANSAVQANEISVHELKGVYLRERNSLNDGTHVEPVLARGGTAHEMFVKLYLKQNSDELQRYYETLVFSGKGSMPKAVASDADVVAYVAKTRGAIGYVNAETNAPGVKTLAVINALSGSERAVITYVAPEYPSLLRQQRIGGIVRLKLIATPKGDVRDVEVIGGNPILGEAAVAAVQRWRFAAGSSQTLMEVSIPFEPN